MEPTISPSQTSSRSHSFASTTSSNSNNNMMQNNTTETLSATARTILSSSTYSTETQISNLSQYLSPQIQTQHNDDPPQLTTRETYLTSHLDRIKSLPESYRLDVQETCVDESQMKVWVRSEISGLPDGVRKQSISMLSFNAEGELVSSVDFLRRVRDDDDDEEEKL